MAHDQHIRTDHYVLARRGRIGRGTRALQVHRHLVQVCPRCSESWQMVSEEQAELERLLLAGDHGELPPHPAPAHHQSAYSWQIRRVEREESRLKRLRTKSARNGWEVVKLSREERTERVERAWSRYRTRMAAEYLLEKAHQAAGKDPLDGESLAATARRVLRRIEGAATTWWAVELEARIAVCRARALRRAGDPSGAGDVLATLRRTLADAPLYRPGAVGEAALLQADLETDRDRPEEARHTLQVARFLGLSGRDRTLQARALVRQGRLHAARGEAADALDRFRDAVAVLDGGMDGEATGAATGREGRREEPPAAAPDGPLYLAAMDGWIGALCDAGRTDEAATLLDCQAGLYESWDDLLAGAVVRHHQGRIALRRERPEEAALPLRHARRSFLDGSRPREAVLAAADLARVHAARGEDRELVQLARSLAPRLRDRRFSPASRHALRRLLEALEERAVPPTLVAALRRCLLFDALRDPQTPPLPPLP